MIDMLDQTPYKAPLKVVTTEDVEMILELYSCGVFVNKIAEKFEISTSTVNRVVKRNYDSKIVRLKNRIRQLELACGIKTQP